MLTPEQIAAEMIPHPTLDPDAGVYRTDLHEPWSDGDFVPMEPQRDYSDALALAQDARAILARLIERIRKESQP